MIIEFREFFLRTVKVFTGSKADQELNYPVTNVVNTCNGKENKYNRLLSEHYASDDVIKKFTESITFKLNPEDTAKDEQQGLSYKSVDKHAADNYIETTDFTRTLQSHQLPVIIDAYDILQPHKYFDLQTGAVYETISDAIASGNHFVKALLGGGSSASSNFSLIESVIYEPLQEFNDTIYTILNRLDVSMANHLTKEGDTLEYKLCYGINADEATAVDWQLIVSDGTNEMTIATIYTQNSVSISNTMFQIDVCIVRDNMNRLMAVSKDTSDVKLPAPYAVNQFNMISNNINFPTLSFYMKAKVIMNTGLNTAKVMTRGYKCEHKRK
jgi:hypothetical protein